MNVTKASELEKARRACGLSLEEFGRLVGFDPAYRSRIEHGAKPSARFRAGAEKLLAPLIGAVLFDG